MSQGNTFDIVFAGAGPAGCVAAGRLASANPDLRILILEAGPQTLNVEAHVQPAACISNLFNPERRSKSYATHVAQSVSTRPVPVLAGRVVGGGSCVNLMVYTRASASDYDTWETVHKNPGWGSKDLIPLLKEIESYGPESFNSTHGSEGPIRVSFPKDHIKLSEQFLEVAQSYDKVRTVEDWNDFNAANGYGVWAKYVNDKTGRRSDAAHNFIYNQSNNKNLIVHADSRVVRVLFEGTRAIGVEYVDQTSEGSPTSAFASKLVVLSAGPFGSAPVLERSGIGAEQILRQHGVSQLINLPGVGANFQDHQLTMSRYVASDDAETLDHVLLAFEENRQSDPKHLDHLKEWRESGKGLMARNGFDIGYKLRPSSDDVQKLGPAFGKLWEEFFAPYPDRPLVLGGMTAFCSQNMAPRPGKYFGLSTILAYPTPSGTIHITHGINSNNPLDFQYSYVGSEVDIVAHRWAYKHFRELARRMPFYSGELQNSHPVFPNGSDVASKVKSKPVAIDAPNLVYTPEDDKAIDEYHRKTVASSWHSVKYISTQLFTLLTNSQLGACSMKPRNEGGVVDSRLNVYGTTQLKVADMSICPSNVGANTYNTALAIGSKAALLIAEDLGLNL